MAQLIVIISILIFLTDLGSDGRVGKPGFSQSELWICSLPIHDHNFGIKWGNYFKENDQVFRKLPNKIALPRDIPEILKSFESLDHCQFCRPPPFFY